MAAPASPLPSTLQVETTSDDRTMAVLAHSLQMVGGFIAPLVIFLVKRQSRFVAFHSLQVLLFEIFFMAAWMCVFMVMFASVMLTVFAHGADHTAPPTAFLILFPFAWLFFMGVYVLKIVAAVIYSLKAGRGEWAEYPVFGGLARKILKIGPGGARWNLNPD
jgi:uncharacterized membrane protein